MFRRSKASCSLPHLCRIEYAFSDSLWWSTLVLTLLFSGIQTFSSPGLETEDLVVYAMSIPGDLWFLTFELPYSTMKGSALPQSRAIEDLTSVFTLTFVFLDCLTPQGLSPTKLFLFSLFIHKKSTHSLLTRSPIYVCFHVCLASFSSEPYVWRKASLGWK